jgi:chromosomal replication initiation ATPase DnaA
MKSFRQFPLALEHRPSLAGEDFLVAESNSDAVRWLQRWPDWPSTGLIVHGPPGCGKTHLAHVFGRRCGGLLIGQDALGLAQPVELAARAGVLIVDDADQLVAAASEVTLLHLYNTVAERGGHLFLTAQTPAARWSIRLADLSSRLNAATSVGIGAPDDDLIAGILVKLFADRHLKVDDELISYALPRIERTFDGARRLVAALDSAAMGSRRKVTVSLLREVLKSAGAAR